MSEAAITLLFILVPLLATFIAQRLFLHVVNPNVDLFILGHNVHHLFVGCVLAIPAAFVLAFQADTSWPRRIALACLGVGSSMVLDQLVYLIVTDGSNGSYLKPVSLWSAIILHALAAAVLTLLFAIS